MKDKYRIRVRTKDSVLGIVNEFWVSNPKKIEWYETLAKSNPVAIRIIKHIGGG